MKSESTKPFNYLDYLNVKTTIQNAMDGPPFYGLVIGNSGMGKTSLVRELSENLDRHRHRIIYLSSSQASLVGITRFLSQAFHVTPKRNHLETVKLLADAIITHPSHLLLWVDEACQIDPDALQEIRMLAESDMRSDQIFSVVLSALPTISTNLDRPALFPLKRRISLFCRLSGLQRDELQKFLDHHFSANETEQIPDEVLDELFERTQATPALIQKVVRRALRMTENEQLNLEVIHAALNADGL